MRVFFYFFYFFGDLSEMNQQMDGGINELRGHFDVFLLSISPSPVPFYNKAGEADGGRRVIACSVRKGTLHGLGGLPFYPFFNSAQSLISSRETP